MKFNSIETIYEKYGSQVKAVTGAKHKLMTFHSGRKFFISTCVNSGITLSNIMAWSGHKNISVVNAYIKKGMNAQEQMKNLFKSV